MHYLKRQMPLLIRDLHWLGAFFIFLNVMHLYEAFCLNEKFLSIVRALNETERLGK